MKTIKSGISLTVQTVVIIVITVAISLTVLSLTRPWEVQRELELQQLSTDMTRLYEALHRRGGSVMMTTQVKVVQDYLNPSIEATMEGMVIWPPTENPMCKVSNYQAPKIPAIIHERAKTAIPGVFYVDKGIVDVSGGYVAGGKKNYTDNPSLDVVSFVEYTSDKSKYVILPRPFIKAYAGYEYGHTTTAINLLIRYILLIPTPKPEAGTEWVSAPNVAITIRYNGTVRSFCTVVAEGGNFEVKVDGETVYSFSVEEPELGKARTIIRVIVDYVKLNIFSQRR